MRELIKRFIDCNVPTQVCNLACPYCYVGQVKGFSGKIRTIDHTPAEVRAALSKRRMGGIIFINFCGTGETLLGEEILPIVHEVLKEGHFVQIVTNGTISKRFDELIGWDRELLSRLLVKFSYHYSEFLRLNLLDVFFNNVLKVRDAGCSFSVEITSGDGMIPYIDEMKRLCFEKCGAMPHVTVARDNADPEDKLLTRCSVDDYENIWGTFDSALFDVKMKLYGEKRKEFCYGGEWTFYLYLSNGDLKQCYKGAVIDNIFEDVTRPIHFQPIGRKCQEPYCYNGHAWMTLGCIPGMNVPSYADVRNRITADGKAWLTERAKEFFSHKLEENNIIYDNETDIPKILFLGDSISKGYREHILKKCAGKIDVYYPNEITTFSTHMLRYIQEYAEKLFIGTNIAMVYFNAGLWDVLRINGDDPLVSIGEYERNLKKIVYRLRYVFPNAKLVFATTTPVREELATFDFSRLNSDIEMYNAVACRVMDREHIAVHDLNKFAVQSLSGQYIDFTHFTEDGYITIAEEIIQYINASIKNTVSEKQYGTLRIMDEQIQSDPSVLSKKRIVIYGGGDYGERVIRELGKRNITPFVICDRSKKKQGQSISGVQIISPEKYMEEVFVKDRDILIVAVSNPHSMQEVIRKFETMQGLDICTYHVLCKEQ